MEEKKNMNIKLDKINITVVKMNISVETKKVDLRMIRSLKNWPSLESKCHEQ